MTYPTVVVELGFSVGASTSSYLHLDDAARGKLGTGTLAPTTGVWTDVTTYVRALSTKRGSSRADGPFVRYEAGTASVTLDNSDRRFDPTNTDGPYAAAGITQVTPMRAIRIRATWAGVTYDLFRGFVDSWSVDYAPGDTYSEVIVQATDAFKVLSSYDRVATGAVGTGEDSGARVTRILNSVSWPATDRVIATGNTTVQSTTLDGDPLTEAQLVADTEMGEFYVDGAGRVVFRNRNAMVQDTRSKTSQATFGDSEDGAATNLSTNPSFETDSTGWSYSGPGGGSVARSTTRASTGTASLLLVSPGGGLAQAFTPTGTSGYPVTGSTSYTFAAQVWPSTGVSATMRVVWYDAAGASLAVVDGSATAITSSTWNRLTFTLTSHASAAFASVRVTCSSAASLWIDEVILAAGSATTYFDGDSAGCEWTGTAHASSSTRPDELPYEDVTIDYDDTQLTNLVRITRVGGAMQTAQDTASQTDYLVHTLDRSDLIMQSDSVALDHAEWVLYQSKDPELRFGTLTINPRADEDDLFPQALARELGDRVTIIRRPPGGGDAIERDVFIRGITHDAKADLTWTTTWVLQSASRYAFLTLDHATLGKLDSNALGY